MVTMIVMIVLLWPLQSYYDHYDHSYDFSDVVNSFDDVVAIAQIVATISVRDTSQPKNLVYKNLE